MSKLSAFFVLSCLLAFALAVPEQRQFRQQQQQQLRQQLQQLQHPYLFLSVPRGRANAGAVVQGFEIVEEPEHDDDNDNDHVDDDDDDDDVVVKHQQPAAAAANDDDDDDNEDDDNDDDDDAHMPQLHRGLSFARNGQLLLLNSNNNNNDDEQEDDDEQDDDENNVPLVLAKPGLGRKSPAAGLKAQPLLKNAKATQMMVARDQAGAIMVPDGIVEIEGQSVVDEKTGKAALLVPRAALDAIPDGAVVALMERSSVVASDALAVGEERANRVIVRRRKNGGRRTAQRRRRGGRPVQRRRRGGQRRRPNRRRTNVRVVRPNGNRRRGNIQRRRGGQVVLQG